tara:strand:- start:56 stop:355 length:300 start_codon:yes stop_codon:yes gene_type:complete
MFELLKETVINFTCLMFALYMAVKFVQAFIPLRARWNCAMLLGVWAIVESVRLADFAIMGSSVDSTSYQLIILMLHIVITVLGYGWLLFSEDDLIEKEV